MKHARIAVSWTLTLIVPSLAAHARVSVTVLDGGASIDALFEGHPPENELHEEFADFTSDEQELLLDTTWPMFGGSTVPVSTHASVGYEGNAFVFDVETIMGDGYNGYGGGGAWIEFELHEPANMFLYLAAETQDVLSSRSSIGLTWPYSIHPEVIFAPVSPIGGHAGRLEPGTYRVGFGSSWESGAGSMVGQYKFYPIPEPATWILSLTICIVAWKLRADETVYAISCGAISQLRDSSATLAPDSRAM